MTPRMDELYAQCSAFFYQHLPPGTRQVVQESTQPAYLYQDLEIGEQIGTAIDTCLPNRPEKLFQLCLENPSYFSSEPLGTRCITEGALTADHVVYHVLHEELTERLQAEWEQYVTKVRQAGGGRSIP